MVIGEMVKGTHCISLMNKLPPKVCPYYKTCLAVYFCYNGFFVLMNTDVLSSESHDGFHYK